MSRDVAQLEEALIEIQQIIDAKMAWMQHEFDRLAAQTSAEGLGGFHPYTWPDKNGRPILADLVAAKGHLLAALATLDTPDGGAS